MEKYDNYEFETKLYSEGYKYIAGTDEVGRGCIAGPVVACAVIMPKDEIIEGVTDSKLLTDIAESTTAVTLKDSITQYITEMQKESEYEMAKKYCKKQIPNTSIHIKRK